ncbi:hypothetical protein BU26DRAFT_162616 [Trematosphaeria pertusa]|uniref:Uncharacterized protein n=1 Tax=Trematosphaeria pertusa TaxID=390896 RepID=A0A6A6HWN7_9PLEO|nr:uncharacterized protein BU26DRAFT_162616 [Trematosphaeria pertusa]KAF2241983.1 hypothetical protein BU26DRAFT_162616 [Trematosphaeria pertusa]
MVAFKLLTVAAALVSAVVATDDSVCFSAEPITVTVTVTDCGTGPPVAPTPPASSGYVPPPMETTSFISEGPTPSGPAPSGPVPPSGTGPGAPPPGTSEGTPPTSPGPSSGSVTPSASHPGSTPPPPSSDHPQPPPPSSAASESSNFAAAPTAYFGVGQMVAAGMALAALV